MSEGNRVRGHHEQAASERWSRGRRRASKQSSASRTQAANATTEANTVSKPSKSATGPHKSARCRETAKRVKTDSTFVAHVVDLVEDHPRHLAHDLAAAVEHVAQNLRAKAQQTQGRRVSTRTTPQQRHESERMIAESVAKKSNKATKCPKRDHNSSRRNSQVAESLRTSHSITRAASK